MSTTSAISAGRAFIELFVEDGKLDKGLRAAQAKLKAFGDGAMKIGAGVGAASAAILGPLVASVAAFASAGDELTKLSNKTGASVESLSELRHAASQSAVDFNQLSGALAKQQKLIGEAANGSDSAREKLRALGLTYQELSALSPDKQFELIAQKISEIKDPAQRAAAAMEIFGKSGADLLPLMLDGSKGIQALRKEAVALGLQVSTKDANAATLLGDTWANVMDVLKQVSFQIGAALAPMLTSLLQTITPVIVAAINFIKEHQTLVIVLAAVGVALGVLGTTLIATGAALSAASVAMGAFTAATGLAAGAVVVLEGALAVLLSPIALVVLAVGGLVAAFLYLSDSSSEVMAGISDGMDRALNKLSKFNTALNKLKADPLMESPKIKELLALAKLKFGPKPLQIEMAAPPMLGVPAMSITPTQLGPEKAPKTWQGGVVRADGMPMRPDLGDVPKGDPKGQTGIGDSFLTRAIEMAVENAQRVATSATEKAEGIDTEGSFNAQAFAFIRETPAEVDRIPKEQLAIQKKIEENTRRGGRLT